MTSERFDVGVIGGGPGGYVAAIRAAQLGGKVLLIEKDRLGGTCTNWGCIPTKAFVRTVELLMDIKRAGEYGLIVSKPTYDLKRITERMDNVVNRMVEGIRFLLRANGVTLMEGRARISSREEIAVASNQGMKKINASKIVVATGSRAKLPPVPGVDSPGVITSDQALHLEEVPRSLIIVGGGPEGTEFGCIFNALGCQVAIVEMLPHLLPLEDREMGIRLSRILTKRGIKILTNSTVEKISRENGRDKVTVRSPSGEMTLEGDKVMMATGRTPNVEEIGLDGVKVRYTREGIDVDTHMETNVKGIYAVGDVAGGGFAHVASEGGLIAAENAMGLDSTIDLRVVPRCVFAIPEMAAVGLTEKQAKESGYSLRVGKFPFTASGRAQILGETDGVVKVIADSSTEEILGVHIIGPRASDLIPEAALAMKMEATVEDLIKTIHPHPTLSESLKEAALDCKGDAIHVVRRGRKTA